MARDRWERVKAVFVTRPEIPKPERPTLVQTAARGDDEVTREEPTLRTNGREADSIEELSADALTNTLSLPTGGESVAPREAELIDGKYRLERQLGEGGMGIVYRARHMGLGKDFALKLIRPGSGADPFFAERFRTEAAALGRLKHPNIVNVTDFGLDRNGDRAYLVMEYLEGRTLHAERRAQGALALESVLPIVEAVAQALDFAHEHGVLHRDLKPGNVLLCADDGPHPSVKLLDFGLARLVAADSTKAGNMTGPIEGTPAYMAPESLASGVATTASDIYAFGIVVYELLTGRVPFEGTIAEVVQGHLTAPPKVPSSVNGRLPPEVDAVVLALLAKGPEARPRRATEAVAALRRAHRRACEREWKARERPRRLALGVAVGAALAVLGFGFSATGAGRKLERPVIDALFALQPARAPDARLLLVVLDETSLIADPTPLVQRGEEAGRILGDVFDAGARAVALDLLLPAQWSAANAFSELVLKRADALTLAAAVGTGGELVGPEGIDPLTAAALGPARFRALFGLVNVTADDDGVTRRARLFVRDRQGQEHATWPGRVAATAGAKLGLESVWVDAAVDPARLPRLSWKDLPWRLAHDPAFFRGRVVLVGAAYTGSGDELHRVAVRRGPANGLSGIELQALIVNTALAGNSLKEASTGTVWGVTGIGLAGALGAVLCLRRLSLGLAAAAALTLLIAAAAALAFRERWLVPLAGPLLAIALAMVLGLTGRVVLSPFLGGVQR